MRGTVWLADGLVGSGGFVFVVSLHFALVVCGLGDLFLLLISFETLWVVLV